MLTTAEASQAIDESMSIFDSDHVDLVSASGRILRQVVHAERDQPPFDRVTMDGIAIRFSSFDAGNRQFTIQGTQHAGDSGLTLESDQNCIEVMTGSVLPEASDCIVPVERVAIVKNVAVVEDDYQAQARQFIHAKGSDHKGGHEVLRPGITISPLDVAIIASCGLDQVEVSRLPKVSVISTGNELVPPGQPVADHQIRLSNGPALVAMLAVQGFANSCHEHLADNVATLERELKRHLETTDVMILSGGVSMGKADFVPQVMRTLGVKAVFHKISQRPGKPMWFGIGPNGQAVFALPGNPVSSMVCCRQYVLPALFRASGRERVPAQTAVLTEDVNFNTDLTCFLPVRVLSLADGRISATPVPSNTSGDFASLAGTDGYVELRREQNSFPAGSAVPLHFWKSP